MSFDPGGVLGEVTKGEQLGVTFVSRIAQSAHGE